MIKKINSRFVYFAAVILLGFGFVQSNEKHPSSTSQQNKDETIQLKREWVDRMQKSETDIGFLSELEAGLNEFHRTRSFRIRKGSIIPVANGIDLLDSEELLLHISPVLKVSQDFVDDMAKKHSKTVPVSDPFIGIVNSEKSDIQVLEKDSLDRSTVVIIRLGSDAVIVDFEDRLASWLQL